MPLFLDIRCQSLNIFDVRPKPFQFPSKFNPDGHFGSLSKLVLSCSKVLCSNWYSKQNQDSHLGAQPKLVPTSKVCFFQMVNLIWIHTNFLKKCCCICCTRYRQMKYINKYPELCSIP